MGFGAKRTDFRQQEQQHYLQQYLSSASGMEKMKGKDRPSESSLATEPRGDTPSAGYCLVCVQIPAIAYDSITHGMFLSSCKF